MDDDTNKLVKDLYAAVEEKNGGKLTPDQISRISLKLGQLLGNPESHEVTQNEKGQILNEEGLPMTEITEQLGSEHDISSSIITPFSADLPTWTLSEEGKVRRRAERERILDVLEAEERLEEDRDAAEEEQSRAAKKERLQAAREIQKAMGRALVKNIKDFKAKEEQTKNALLEIDTTVCAEGSKRLKPKKSVSFDLPPEESPVSAGPQQDWGDVTPARLQSKQSSNPDASGPMKFRVVERFPRKLQLGPSSGDSDDESDPEPAPDNDEDEPTPTNVVEFHSDESTEDGGDFEFQEGETDLDAAQHQREIALAYYEKREKFAAQAAAAFSSHSHVEEDPWDRPEVPLEASLTGDRPRPAISKFKADRIVSSSTSLDGLVVPASQSALMRDTVKLGKLDGDQLVGGPEDSDDDLKEILELVKQGEVENIGPSLPNGPSSRMMEQDFSSLPPPKVRNKVSRFKVNRGGASRPTEETEESTSLSDIEPPTPVASNVMERRGVLRIEPDQSTRSASPPSVPDTPLTIAERSSPKLPPGDIPVVRDNTLYTPVSRKPAKLAETSQSIVSTVDATIHAPEIVRERTPRPPTMKSPAVVDSPLFKPPSPDFLTHPGAFTTPPMIIDSPEFPPPRGVTYMPSMIIESPDFPPPKEVSPYHGSSAVNTPTPPVVGPPSFPVGPRNPGPPRVMSSQVVERSSTGANQQREGVPGKKFSRFAAERR
ncbi:hypothetical protein BJ322DRAFT_1044706 [Thelephora terrestris]|uniref:DUF3835 domain-containing protein n=1 Tax=Thelephora terrestris TaxID=56493 RepID=A0A9P6HLC6_9AGAM|nr:hypothetical protein BJ322DRAFT_1044706 [Thelephora terrestris]